VSGGLFQTLAPATAEITLACMGCVVLLVDLFVSDRQRDLTFWLALGSVLVTGLAAAFWVPEGSSVVFHGAFVLDPLATTLKVFTCGIVAVTFLYSRDYLKSRNLYKGEYYVLALFATLGILVMISAHSLLSLYLGLELLSLCLYAMVAFDRDNPIAAESAMKYFVLGAIASGCFLYGTSMVYGVTGSVDLGEISRHVSGDGALNLHLLFAISFLLVGLAFKLGAVPFHMWLPDVYHGSPTPVTLFIGTAAKVASFAMIVRVLVDGLGALEGTWSDMLVVLAVLSMAIGNVAAIAQTNLKRMLAYSTISHVGFILLGILAGSAGGLQAALYYTLVYVIMASAAFGMIILLSRRGFEAEDLDDFKGLNARSAWFAGLMLIVMFSMAGIPPFVGFYAKLAVLAAAVDAGHTWLAVAGVIFSVIGAFYYLRVVKLMYFDEPDSTAPVEAGADFRAVLSANALLILVLGLFPGGLLALCARVIG
jgi:NADH-quinone oxidoreductase subunit N